MKCPLDTQRQNLWMRLYRWHFCVSLDALCYFDIGKCLWAINRICVIWRKKYHFVLVLLCMCSISSQSQNIPLHLSCYLNLNSPEWLRRLEFEMYILKANYRVMWLNVLELDICDVFRCQKPKVIKFIDRCNDIMTLIIDWNISQWNWPYGMSILMIETENESKTEK